LVGLHVKQSTTRRTNFRSHVRRAARKLDCWNKPGGGGVGRSQGYDLGCVPVEGWRGAAWTSWPRY
jgi:hypothetical protein